MDLHKKFRTALKIWRSRGWKGIKTRLIINSTANKLKRDYRVWVRDFDTLTDKDREAIRKKIEKLSFKPLISIILPVYDVEEKWLRLCIESVLNQLYTNWELCITDDCSPGKHIRPILEEYAAKDKRIKVTFRTENGHISTASNTSLELATGDFSALLDHDDELSEHALYFIAEEANKFPHTQIMYSDEDMIDEKGKRYSPKFKPEWSQDFFYSLNLVTHLSVYRTELLRKIGGFRVGLEGSQDYDLALRAIERIELDQIRHIPHILYHWRAISGSVALHSDEKPYAHERARQAIREHFERIGKKADISQTVFNFHRVSYKLPENLPKVSLVILIRDNLKTAKEIVGSWIEKTDYSNLEFILISPEINKGIIDVKDFPFDTKVISSFSQSEIKSFNQAVSQATGEILCFTEAQMVPVSNDWLKEMVSFCLQKEIGAVGAKILYPDDTVKNSGFVLGVNGLIGLPHYGLPKYDEGNFARLQVINNFSAVSCACLVVRKEVFEAAGGYDEKMFINKLYGVDFCLRLREKGYRIVYTPYAELMKFPDPVPKNSSGSSETSKDIQNFKDKWGHILEKDPFYSTHFSLEKVFAISLPPRFKKPWED